VYRFDVDSYAVENLLIGGFPLVAIGGITARNFREVFEAGADSVAVIKSILSPPDKIVENLQSFQSFR